MSITNLFSIVTCFSLVTVHSHIFGAYMHHMFLASTCGSSRTNHLNLTYWCLCLCFTLGTHLFFFFSYVWIFYVEVSQLKIKTSPTMGRRCDSRVRKFLSCRNVSSGLRYPWNMTEICLRYAWYMPEIYLRYAWESPLVSHSASPEIWVLGTMWLRHISGIYQA